MRREKLQERIEALKPWFHTIDLGQGRRVERDPVHGGDPAHPQPLWAAVRPMLPLRLDGMRVLDVGCNAGFFSVEAKRLGASYVLGIEAVPKHLEQAQLVRDVLEIDLDLRCLSVYDVTTALGEFDLTFFLGVLYHLRHPLLALERLARVTRGLLVVESAVIPETRFPATLFQRIPDYGGVAHEMRFVENTLALEALENWFVPSPGALRAFLRAAGFTRIGPEVVWANRAVMAARRGA